MSLKIILKSLKMGLCSGAYSCHIKKDGDFYIWENFAYENGYEEPRIFEGVGLYRFRSSEYESAIEFAHAL